MAGKFRLSPQQRRLWRLSESDSGFSGVVQGAAWIHGRLKVGALRRAVERLVERHEILRTTFARPRGARIPLQVVADAGEPFWSLAEGLDRWVDGSLEKRLGNLLQELRSGSFDLEGGPVLRALLVEVAAERHLLVLTLPAMCADGVSLKRFFLELAELYGSDGAGSSEEMQYADLAEWQNELIEGEEAEAALTFWRTRHAELPSMRLRLPFEQPSPGSWPLRGVPLPLTAGAATPSSPGFWLAAWKTLLWRLTESPRLVIGMAYDGRSYDGMEEVVGPLTRYLPIASTPTGAVAFSAFCEQLEKEAAELYDWQEFFSWESLETASAESEAPRFSVGFEFDVLPEAVRSAGVSFEVESGFSAMERFALCLSVWQREGGTFGELRYDPGLMAAGDVRRTAEQLVTLAEHFAGRPESPLWAAPLLSAASRGQLLARFAPAADEAPPTALGDAPATALFSELFTARAREAPDRVALLGDGEWLTFGALAARSAGLARRLRALGVGPEVPVALCLERSPRVVEAMLGVLEAGGYYVPLDPALPDKRLRFMVADLGVRLVLCEPEHAERFPTDAFTTIQVDGEAGSAGEPLAELRVLPENPIYALFTSGSTGKPKAVVVEHRHLLTYLRAVVSRLELRPGARYALVSTFAADLGNTMIFPALATGGCLQVVPARGMTDARALEECFALLPPDYLKIVPSHLEALLGRGGERRHLLPSRALILGGEASRAAWVEELEESFPELRIFNHYGPTETTVGVAVLRPGEMQGEAKPIHLPLGRPLGGSRLWVLDRIGEPLPPWVAGELHVGGECVSRGYFGRPALTAERFVPDALSPPVGGRLYRTGDRARWRSDGLLEFLGRLDGQVKVRGFRIETGEVEVGLVEHPSVREGVVIVRRGNDGGDPRLVAYVVPVEEPGASIEELKRHLGQILPPYMIPAGWVFLPRLPLTPNGKIDRRALPDPEELEAEVPFVAPRTPVEELLCEQWADLLGVEQVGIDHDFFDLGGHSLLATQVIARVRGLFATEIALRDLFANPTVRSLAAFLKGAEGQTLPPLERVSRDDELPLSFAQERLWFLNRLAPQAAAYNMPYFVELRGRLCPEVLRRAFAAVVARHEVLRTTFPSRTGRPLQVISAHGEVALPRIDLRSLNEDARAAVAAALARAAAARPFDLANGPLLRASLLRLADDRHHLLLAMHHIVVDGWSQPRLVRELADNYEAFRQAQPAPVEELPIQYADFAHWQRSWLRGDVLEAKLGYWRRQLQGAPEALDLPTDRSRSALSSLRSSSVQIALDAELVEELEVFGREQGSTLFMTLLSAFQALLGRYSGQNDVCVGTPIAGRQLEETEELIGFFVNTLVLRGDLAGKPSFRQLLTQAREVVLEAHAHQEVPFEKLVDELQTERNLDHSPFFQVMLALQNAPRLSYRLGELELRPLGIETHSAPFDLMLGLAEAEDGLRGQLQYREALFDIETIERLAGHFEALLRSALAAPEKPLVELDLLTAAERRQLLATSAVEIRAEASIPELFAAQVAATPTAPALAHGEVQLTYAELAVRVSSLARLLRARGVEPEVLVGLCVERSIDMIVALLGILESGGAYLPLDPSYPAERLSTMLEEARPSLLLTHTALHLPRPEVPRLCLDALPTETSVAESAERGPSSALAYVIYTSGSTGRPKGIEVSGAALASRALALAESYDLKPGRRLLQFLSLGFDAVGEEIYPVLVSGATLVIDGDPARVPPADYLDRAAALGIDCLHVPPSYWTRILEHLEVHDLPVPSFLRLQITGGESSPFDRLVAWRERTLHGARFVNAYGPSEATITATLFEVPGAAALRELGRLPIGVPLSGARALVLSSEGLMQPSGVVGELALGGALARGYARRPAQTAERFVPDAFSGEPGERLYLSGDLARRSASGNLELFGRLDKQIKVRGFRIEPGEIETVLGQHAAVSRAVVLAKIDPAGETRLVGYLTASPSGSLPPSGELRAHTEASLARYMVPSVFVPLAELPVTANGKVDLDALPEPTWAAAEDVEYVAPRTAVEARVAAVWIEVLKLERVGARDNFFALGGHSLLAAQVHSRLREAFAVDLPLESIFQAPTVEALAAELEKMEGGERVAPAAIELADRDRPLPLSFAQQRLWFLDQLEPGNPFYNMPTALRLQGRLVPAALEAALVEVVRRHEALRTSFVAVDGVPAQQVGDSAVRLPRLDLGGLEVSRAESLGRRLVGAEMVRPFDLARGPLVRGLLVRLGEGDYVLVLTLHHIASDGWSMGVLVRELVTCYHSLSAARPPGLAPLPIQYADFAVWQRGWLTGEELERQLAYWRNQLIGAPSLLELPADRPRPPVQSYAGASHARQLSPELSTGVLELSHRHEATPFMTLLAVWATVLARWSGQGDLVMGTPVANRGRPELEGLIGFFVNTLVMRVSLNGDLTWQDLLGRVRRTALEAYEHQDLPFERLVEGLEVERSLSHAPVFQVLLAMQNTPSSAVELPELKVTPLELDETVAKFDMALSASEWGGRLTLGLEYSTALFDPTTAERLLSHLERALSAAVADPGDRLARLSLLSPGARQQLLVEWNATARAEAGETSICDLIARSVTDTPDAPAALRGGEQLTYRELGQRAGELARRLVAAGVGPETVVGLCVERSFDMLVGLYGILQAGGAYLPIEPSYPRDRVELMLDDARPALVLTQTRLRDGLPSEQPCWCLDEELPAVSGSLPAVSGDHLAYVIYTSGSTGRPKGVMVTHRSLINLTHVFIDEFGLTPGKRVLMLLSLSFDASVGDLFPTLASGATLVLHRAPEELVGGRLQRFCEDHAINVIEFATAVWQPWVEDLSERQDGRMPTALETVVCGGEAVTTDKLEAWLALAERPVSFRHNYGPTEATVCCTYYGIESAVARRLPPGKLPIGRPVDNAEAYVLDRALQPVPLGIPGELSIGGLGVARGYLGRPGLTAERFQPLPWGDEPGRRLYRTGDLVRWLPGSGDGAAHLEFLGRVDQQIKIRGFRIEPGEIEAALGLHPAVREKVVRVHEDEGGRRRLVAYLTIEEEEAGVEESARALLAERLPAFMVPSAFVVLESLPLTAHGKVDDRRLPIPDWRQAASRAHVEPRNAREAALAGIWSEVLGLERVGVEDDFFALGGHSLLATQVISRVEQRFGVELPVRQLFERPTIAALSVALEGMATRRVAPELRPTSRERPLPLSFAQERLWFLDRLQPGMAAYNMPLVLRLHGTFDVVALAGALDCVVARHESLRTTFAARGGASRQVIAPAASGGVSLVDLTALSPALRESEIRRRVQAEILCPFDLARGPLFRSRLLRLATDEHVLMLVMHHAVSDGWSMQILMRDLVAFYRAGSATVALPPLAVQYADYAAWQRSWLSGNELERQVDFWRRQLEGAPQVLELPADRPRSPLQTAAGGTCRRQLSGPSFAALQAAGRSAGATLFMSLLAAWSSALTRWSGQREVLVGTPIAGRTRPELEDLIGFFVNTLVLRTSLTEDPSFAGLLEQVRDRSFAAFAHQDLPFERLVESLEVERSLDRSPLFQVMLTVQNTPNAVIELPDLRFSPVEVEATVAKFELSLTAAQAGDSLSLSLEYASDLFDRTTAERRLDELCRLLEQAVTSPSRPLSSLGLLSRAQAHQALSEWNDTELGSRPPGAAPALLAEPFESRAAAVPDAIALVFGSHYLSYGELNARANRFAHHLRSLGVGPETRVGICVERSLQMVVAVWAVLKAGGAYVPLEPSYPRERQRLVFEDAALMLLIAPRSVTDPLGLGEGQRLCPREDGEAIRAWPAENPPTRGSTENLAYAIYTSGSTGRPKGVMVDHRAALSLRRRHLRTIPYPKGPLCLTFNAPLVFDVSVSNLLLSLLEGHSLLMLSDEERLDGRRLVGRLRAVRADVAEFTPSHLQAVIEAGLLSAPGAPPRLMVVGGERMGEGLYDTLKQNPEIIVCNAYGPTETTVDATVCRVSEATSGAVIGRPLVELRAYVLDHNLRPVAQGCSGELCLGGDGGLARGYLGRPALTAAAFLPDSFADTRGGRLYRTGDRVRQQADGKLEFLERLDEQVKVRGFRIELGEVEAVLAEHPALTAVAVAPHGTGVGTRLVAYLVPREGVEPPGDKELEQFLGDRLPSYMVPSAFLALERLPTTASNKVDRKALPAPDLSSDQTYIAPRDATELALVEIWEELLDQRPIGVHDHFFELGGHSLLATRVVSRIEQKLGVELPLRQLFEQPTIAALGASLAGLVGGGRAIPELRPSSRVAPPPLSFAQERLWFLDQLQPGVTAYNMPLALRLEGSLDRLALVAGLEALVHRHEALRTTFSTADGEPHQVISAAPWHGLLFVDLDGLPAPRREAALRDLAAVETGRAFNLEQGPLFRGLLARLGAEEHALVLTMHHIASDGWSMEVLTRDLVAFYRAFESGAATGPQPLAVQYGDYAEWQRSWLSGEELERQIDFWRRHLEGAPQVLELPTDRPRSPLRAFAGGLCIRRLPPSTRAGLQVVGRSAGATLFMSLLAGWSSALTRWSGQREVLVGTPIAGRTRPELEDLIGFFVNTLVLRTSLTEDPSFAELLEQVRDRSFAAFAHQDLPFERLVESLEVERSLDRSPLFQVLLTVQNTPTSSVELPSLRVSSVELEATVAKFELSLTAVERGDSLDLGLEYSRELFDSTTAERRLDELCRLLEQAVSSPSRALSSFGLLSRAQTHQAVAEWNDTRLGRKSPSEEPSLLSDLFERRASSSPDATALVLGSGYMSYGALNARANRLARHLHSLGVGPETRVGVCQERTLELVVSILAVLKTGGAYVPIEPSYPLERQRFMFEDASLSLLLAPRKITDALGLAEGQRLCPVEDSSSLLSWSADDLGLGAGAGNLAYVIYTSGSTGRPKGVAIEHRSALSLVRWALDAFPGSAFERLLAATSVCFDLSVFELFVPLSGGGTAVLVEDVLAFRSAPEWARVTLINTVPSPMRELLSLGPLPSSVSVVNLAGEPLPAALASDLYAEAGVESVRNLYGPSEDTTYSTWVEVSRSGKPTIGRPLAGTRGYVLSSLLAPQPLGVPGELCLGGSGLARGYLGRPSLTAESYIPDPFSGAPGCRLYRTGDRVRQLPDGELEFLERLDDQVKVRGFRIELGEVESVLTRHPGLIAAAVSAREGLGGARLVAYVVAADGGEVPERAELREFLGSRLPSHMVPSAFVALEVLPKTPSGKVDRKALPAPELSSDKAYIAPRDATELALVEIWEELLDQRPIGIHDDFFDLGGHSLLATRVVSRVEQKLGVELPLRQLFEQPTIAALGASLAGLVGGGRAIPELRPSSRVEPPPLSFAQERLWFLDRLQPGATAYNMPMALRLSGALNRPALAAGLEALVHRHEALRTTFSAADGAPRQVISAAVRRALPCVDLGGLPAPRREVQARRLAADEAGRAFDLERGPLLRDLLIRLDLDEHVLVLTMHHIVSDGWSMQVLTRDLVAFYRAFESGLTAGLQPLRVQYGDYAEWQRNWLSGEELERQIDFWRQHLEGAPQVLELPTDRPRSALRTAAGGTCRRQLSGPPFAALRAAGRAAGATLFMSLLAGWSSALTRWSGQREVLVGTPIAGRTRPELEDLIGFFVNTLVLRTSLTEDPSFAELLEQVRDRSFAAFAHQDLPFERLVESLEVERSLDHSPLFQVLLTVQNTPASSVELPSLRVSSVELEATVAKFELSLSAVELGDSLDLGLGYSSDLFDRTTAERRLAELCRLLEQAVAAPSRPLSSFDLLSRAQSQQLLAEWNDTWRAPEEPVSLSELFEAQAKAAPAAVAVVCGSRSLSYGELSSSANRLAHHLRAMGVGPEQRVGICLERSLELVVSVWAVLKAGAAYVPLEPSYPRERQRLIVEDASLSMLIASRSVTDTLGLSKEQRLCPRADFEAIQSRSAANPPARASSGNLAYAIYTSGSTGRPKGVMVEHRAALSLRRRLLEAIRYPRRSLRVAFNAPLVFDASIPSLLSLLDGHELLLLEDAERLDGGRLVERLRAMRVDVSHFTPSHLQAALDAGLLGASGAPSTLLVGGERIGEALFETLAQSPGMSAYNVYGPTEATVDATSSAVLSGSSGSVIGRPLTNLRAHVLDRHLRPVPLGCAGELCLGSEWGLARGYLERAALTAAAYCPDPFSGRPGQRLYRTGDRARQRADGRLEFLERLDHQVKVRGFRIELGEVESALARYPALQAAAVVAQEAAGGARLVAYVVSREDEAELESQELERFLAGRLPGYMVPSIFVSLDRLPTTASGKIDRKALPAPDLSSGRAYEAPRNATELALVEIWEGLLDHRPVGIRDNFFELGGHSLLAARMMARIETELGRELALAVLFQAPTIEGLGDFLRRGADAGRGRLVEIQKGAERAPLFGVHPVGGNVLCYRDLSLGLGPAQPFYGLTASGLEIDEEPASSIREMALSYIAAIQEERPRGPRHLLGWSMGGVVAYEMARQLWAAGEPVSSLALIDTQLPGRRASNQPDDAMMMAAMLLDLEGAVTPPVKLYRELAPLSEEERWRHALERLHRGDSQSWSEERLRRLFRVFRANVRAHAAYRPEPYEGRVELFVAGTGPLPRRFASWKKKIKGDLVIHRLPGDHYSIMQPPRVATLAASLKGRLGSRDKQNA